MLTINKNTMQAEVDGRPVPLTATEYRMLVYLATNPGFVKSTEQIVNACWRDPMTAIDRASVQQLISRLRKKIGYDYIVTRRELGYTFQPNGQEIE